MNELLHGAAAARGTGARVRAACLAWALLTITVGVNLHVPLYPAIAAQGGHGLAATTLAYACYVVGVIPVLLLLGGLSDRVGRRPVMLAALALSGTATLVMALWPQLLSLALARWLLGVGSALMSATALAYMHELLAGDGADTARAANWITASTSLGFGLGPVVTTLTMGGRETLAPPSYALHGAALVLAAVLLGWLARPAPSSPLRPGTPAAPMLRLPSYPPGAAWFGFAILLAWATSGLVISVLPAVLARHGLANWSGATTLLAISCGLLFQPAARRCPPARATAIGLWTLLPAYGLLAFGALQGQLACVLLGALLASSACYGFVYLGGLAGVAERAGGNQARVSAGFFVLAYVGFSVPVVFTGAVADHWGQGAALAAFGGFLLLGVSALLGWRRRRPSLMG
ncbi:MAG: MFS transporter [Comamonas sp.]